MTSNLHFITGQCARESSHDERYSRVFYSRLSLCLYSPLRYSNRFQYPKDLSKYLEGRRMKANNIMIMTMCCPSAGSHIYYWLDYLITLESIIIALLIISGGWRLSSCRPWITNVECRWWLADVGQMKDRRITLCTEERSRSLVTYWWCRLAREANVSYCLHMNVQLNKWIIAMQKNVAAGSGDNTIDKKSATQL